MGQNKEAGQTVNRRVVAAKRTEAYSISEKEQAANIIPDVVEAKPGEPRRSQRLLSAKAKATVTKLSK